METVEEKNVNRTTTPQAKTWTFTPVTQSTHIYRADRPISTPCGRGSDDQKNWWLGKGGHLLN